MSLLVTSPPVMLDSLAGQVPVTSAIRGRGPRLKQKYRRRPPKKRSHSRSDGDCTSQSRRKRQKTAKWRKKVRRAAEGAKVKTKHRPRIKPEAPFNSTQFLMEEHDMRTAHRHRQRDSSFSLESEDQLEEEIASDNEEQFVTREFCSAYEELYAERLTNMTKDQLVQEYLELEARTTVLGQELRKEKLREREHSPIGEEDEVGPGEIRVDSETAAKIEVFQQEIEKLEQENRLLREDSRALRSCRERSRRSRTESESSHSNSSSNSDEGTPDPLGISVVSSRCLPAEEHKRVPDLTADSGVASLGGTSSSGEDKEEKEENKLVVVGAKPISCVGEGKGGVSDGRVGEGEDGGKLQRTQR